MWMLSYAVMDAGIGLDVVIALNAVIVLFHPAAFFWNHVWDVFLT